MFPCADIKCFTVMNTSNNDYKCLVSNHSSVHAKFDLIENDGHTNKCNTICAELYSEHLQHLHNETFVLTNMFVICL